MPNYYITSGLDDEVVIIRMDGSQMTSFTENPQNSDWIAYQEWVAEGNTPEPWQPAA